MYYGLKYIFLLRRLVDELAEMKALAETLKELGISRIRDLKSNFGRLMDRLQAKQRLYGFDTDCEEALRKALLTSTMFERAVKEGKIRYKIIIDTVNFEVFGFIDIIEKLDRRPKWRGKEKLKVSGTTYSGSRSRGRSKPKEDWIELRPEGQLKLEKQLYLPTDLSEEEKWIIRKLYSLGAIGGRYFSLTALNHWFSRRFPGESADDYVKELNRKGWVEFYEKKKAHDEMIKLVPEKVAKHLLTSGQS